MVVSCELTASSLWKVLTTTWWLQRTGPGHARSFQICLLMTESRIHSQQSNTLSHSGDKEPLRLPTPTRSWRVAAPTSPHNSTPTQTRQQWVPTPASSPHWGASLYQWASRVAIPSTQTGDYTWQKIHTRSRRNQAAELGLTQRPLHVFSWFLCIMFLHPSRTRFPAAGVSYVQMPVPEPTSAS